MLHKGLTNFNKLLSEIQNTNTQRVFVLGKIVYMLYIVLFLNLLLLLIVHTILNFYFVTHFTKK